MAQSLYQHALPRWLLPAGGPLQHARSLLSLTSSTGVVGSSSSSSSTGSSSSSSGPVLNQAAGRSISTTRGIYMGRVFIKENLHRHPPQSPLFNRETYQYLEKNGWSLAAAEQVLHSHHRAQGHWRQSAVFKQLMANIIAAQSLDQLQLLINRHAHQMTVAHLSRAISRTPQVMFRPNGAADYQGAALVLESIGRHLQPKAAELDAASICYVMSSYVRCRSSPPADLMHELLQSLLLNDSEKLHRTTSVQLGMLLLSLTRMVQPQGQWPLMRAVLGHATGLLKQQLHQSSASEQQQQQQEEAAGADNSSNQPAEQQQQQQQAQGEVGASAGPGSRWERDPHKVAVDTVNATALIALLLDKSNTFSPEYLRLLYQWLEDRDRLALLYPNAAVQLWTTLKGQWAKFEARTSANSPSAEGAVADAAADADAAAPAAAAEAAAGGGDGDAVAAAAADMPLLSSSSPRLSIEATQEKLQGFFGKEALASLAQTTVPLVTSMTEQNLGQLFSGLGRLRYVSPELLSAATGAYSALCAAQTPTHITKANAAWAAAQLQHYEPALIMPAVLAAVQTPQELGGFLAARIMIATSQMPEKTLQQLQLLLRQELHRQSGARGPAPAAAAAAASGAAADPATAAAGQVPDWIASLADSLTGRVPELRPREIAYILLSYSQLPGVPVHERLFAAAAEHIAAHADTFVQLDDMEMVATAFERFNFKDGLPALKALQQQSEKLVSASGGGGSSGVGGGGGAQA